MYFFGFRDSSASAPEFSQPMKPDTASAKVRPTRPRNPPGDPPWAWNGAPRWFPCTSESTATDKMISPMASQQQRHGQHHPAQRDQQPPDVPPVEQRRDPGPHEHHDRRHRDRVADHQQ